MPTRPPARCAVGRCPNKQPCPDHRPQTWNVNPARGKTAQRGYGSRHVAWRATILARDPTCCYGFPGCTGVSTVADHIVRIAKGGDRFDLNNGVGACRRCHAIKSQQESRG